MSIRVFSLFSSWSVVCLFFFPWLLLFMSFSANHQAGLASWAALLKGSYPPKREKPEVSENAHPPCSFLSLSLSPICALEWGKRFLGEGVLIPALPCLVVRSGGSFTPSLTLCFPICKIRKLDLVTSDSLVRFLSHLCLWVWHTTDNSAETLLFWASQHDPPFSWLTTQDLQAGIYSPPHILGASEEADSIPHLPLPPPLGPCARSKLICELHPLGDFSPKWIQPAEVWRFCLLAGGGKIPFSPGTVNQGPNSPPKLAGILVATRQGKRSYGKGTTSKEGAKKGTWGLVASSPRQPWRLTLSRAKTLASWIFLLLASKNS